MGKTESFLHLCQGDQAAIGRDLKVLERRVIYRVRGGKTDRLQRASAAVRSSLGREDTCSWAFRYLWLSSVGYKGQESRVWMFRKRKGCSMLGTRGFVGTNGSRVLPGVEPPAASSRERLPLQVMSRPPFTHPHNGDESLSASPAGCFGIQGSRDEAGTQHRQK